MRRHLQALALRQLLVAQLLAAVVAAGAAVMRQQPLAVAVPRVPMQPPAVAVAAVDVAVAADAGQFLPADSWPQALQRATMTIRRRRGEAAVAAPHLLAVVAAAVVVAKAVGP